LVADLALVLLALVLLALVLLALVLLVLVLLALVAPALARELFVLDRGLVVFTRRAFAFLGFAFLEALRESFDWRRSRSRRRVLPIFVTSLRASRRRFATSLRRSPAPVLTDPPIAAKSFCALSSDFVRRPIARWFFSKRARVAALARGRAAGLAFDF
jgi:hypothetical protein